ncbi:hypothetical protein H8D83_01365, partial [Candidatus Woesearchaeota archaeon]|nr:hypothetical protein [Candidatus Woesearchaeota archaeon]
MVKRGLMNKKSQITSFIIIGILMLFIFSAAVYLRVKVIDKSIEGKGVEVITQDPVEDLNQTEPVEDF